jgi:hypothetical protein
MPKMWQCTRCPYARTHKQSVVKHEHAVHDKILDYPCTFCSKQFSGLTNLQTHVRRIHTGELPYACNATGCTETFATASDVVVHAARQHDGVRQPCLDSECAAREISFASVSELCRHRLSHTRELRHFCTWPNCSFGSGIASNLQTHLRLHTGELRPQNACTWPDCDFIATRHHNLQWHLNSHAGLLPFKCEVPMCGYMTTWPANLAGHTKNVHSKAYEQRQRQEEMRVQTALRGAGLAFDRETTIQFSCFATDGRCARLDFVLFRPDKNLVIILEVDEHQHAQYTVLCESRRTMDIVTAIRSSGLHGYAAEAKILLLRYNPNAYSIDGTPQHTTKPTREARLLRLLVSDAALDACFAGDAYFATRHMFYSTVGGQAAVLTDPDYPAVLADTVLAGDV